MNTNLRKRTFKKLIKDTCSKTVFTANKKLYQQVHGVSMGSSVGALRANVIMTGKLWNGTLLGNLLMVKLLCFIVDLNRVHNVLNNFDRNFKFTH